MPFDNRFPIESPQQPMPAVTLADQHQLSVARVLELHAEGDDLARLKAIGICVGRHIQLVQSGDPLIVRVVGIRIGLSKRLAELVLMQPIAPTSAVSGTDGVV